MQKTHHIGLSEEMAKDVVLWLVSGEPARTRTILENLAPESFKETGRKLPIGRGYLVREINGYPQRINIGLATTGMGMSSTEITMIELMETALRANPGQPLNIIRIGTSGTHQPEKVYGGDLVIAKDVYTVFGAVDDLIETKHENSDRHLVIAGLQEEERKYVKKLERGLSSNEKFVSERLDKIRCELAENEIMQVPSCDSYLISLVEDAAKRIDLKDIHAGSVFSKQTLFSECYPAFMFEPEGLRKARLDYRAKVMHELGILASEMEQAMLNSLAHLAQLKGHQVRTGGIMAVVNNPRPGEGGVENKLFADEKVIQKAVDRAINLGLETAVELYKAEHLK